MQFLYILLSLIAGGLIGFFYQKSRTAKIVTEKELLKKENEYLQQQGQDWKKIKEESLNAAKAAMFEVTNQISSKLIEDHKRENEEAKKHTYEITQKNSQDVIKEFRRIAEKVSELDGNLKKQDTKISTVWQALSSPGGAGSFAEIGLENTLKNFGLEQGRDFITQYSVNYDGSRLRPDAVVFLPSGNLMVIDSKSSKLFLEIAATEQDDSQLYEKLKATMNNHLNGLASKNYRDAIKEDAKQSGEITIINVMYLPNEAALQRVMQADAEFRSKCYKKDIILADPASLQLLLNIATHEIARAKREHNFQIILKEIGKLISSIDIFLRGVDSVGKAIKKAGENFAELGKTANSRLLPRIKRVVDLGVEPEKELKLPDSLPNFSITENEVITLDAEEAELKIIEKKAG